MSLKTEEVKHEHRWIFAGYEQNRCNCGAIELSEQELARRGDEWRAFDAMVRETESYFDWKAMSEAFKAENRNMKLVHEIAKRAKARLDRDEYMPHPPFPDPATFPYVLKGAER